MKKTARSHAIAVLLALLSLALRSSGHAQQAPVKLPSPPEVWQDYHPDAGDFKEEIVREETKDGVYSRDSYISAYVLDEEVRVFCKYAVKAGAKNAPGLMNVHGWMSSPGIDAKFVQDGWAVMAHDYCGKTGNRSQFTKYPEKLRYGNMDAAVGYRVKSRMPDGKDITDPRQTDDYLWGAIQRRVLSYLLAQKEVDKERIGAQGYSYGGSIIWNLGMDPRVKAIVAFFGIGWIDYYRDRGVYMYNVPYVEPPKSPGEELMLSAIAPEAHAPYIRAASLWLNGTNDHHGGHERGEQTFKRFQPGVPWSFAHQARAHHDTTKLGQDAKLWLEKHVLGKDIFWPERPKSEIKLGADGVPELHVTPASPEKVQELQIYYALKNPVSFARFWADATAVRQGDSWSAKLPVLHVDDYVFAFANIRYDSNGAPIVISTDFQAAIPSKLGKAVATEKLSDTFPEADGMWTNTGPVEGVGGVKGFRVLNNSGTTSEQFNNPKWKAPPASNLSFRFYCTQPQTLMLEVDGQYEREVEITASEEWQSMQVQAASLIHRQHKQPLKDWAGIGSVTLKPKPGMDISKVVFAEFKWIASAKAAESGKAPAPEKEEPKEEAKADVNGRVYLTRRMAGKVQAFVRVMDDQSFDGNKIRVGGKAYERGLGTHAPAELEFPLNGRYASFHVVPGPDDEHRGVLEMRILVDGREVYASGKTSSIDGSIRKPLSIPVKDAKTLTLIVTDAGDTNGGDHASWADAYLTLTEAAAKARAAAVPVVIRGGKVAFSFGKDGRPLSFTHGDDRNLIRQYDPGPGFHLTYGKGTEEKIVPLDELSYQDGKLIVTAAGQPKFTFAVKAGETHVGFRIERVENMPGDDKPVLGFQANFDHKVMPEVVPFDYMTVSPGLWASVRCIIKVSWPYFWRRGESDPMGGFAFFVPQDDEDHNETLLRIWAQEGLPHPKVTGEWTVERARQWVAEWQKTFARCDQLTITAKRPEDLDVMVAYAEKLKVNRLYLHTDTWRGAYWVYDRDPLSINTAVFPRGEADLKAFNDRLKERGMDAMLHTICYGFGLSGSKYIGKTVDRRLANWGKGKLEKSISATDKTILFRPAPGLAFPSPDSFGSWWKFNDVLIGNEIIRGRFTNTDQPVWTFTDCQRVFQAANHEAGEEIIGLLKAYDQNYYPDSMTTLSEETAREYAAFFNRLGIRHHEYDGGECHADVPWGFSKWTMFVYQNTDHPITSNSSGGQPNPWDLVYRFKVNGSTLLSQRGGGHAALFTHESRRPATSPIENHFTLARGAAANGVSFNFGKPEPMFGITPEAIQGHGMASLLADQFSIWREVAGKLSPEQRKLIAGAYYPDPRPLPLDAGHAVGRTVFEARRTESGFEVQPFQIMTRGEEDVEWKTVQEFGAVMPRQYVLPGTRLRLENPYQRQAPQFIIRVMHGLVEGVAKQEGGQTVISKDLAGYLQASGATQTSLPDAAIPSAPANWDSTLNLLQPKAGQIQDPGRHQFADNGAALEIAFDNSQDEEYFQLNGLPSYKVRSNSKNARGLALTVTGDGSGAFLVVQTTKDYVIPIDFTGRKDMVIPCGEAAWATGRWGLRFSSKGAGYGPFGRVAIGFGRVPANTSAKVMVENLRVLGEQPSTLKAPVIHAGPGTLAITGEVRSDQYLWYQGGNTVGVYDLNWHLVATLPAVRKDYEVDQGFSEFRIEGKCATPLPWFDVQFITKGEVIPVLE